MLARPVPARTLTLVEFAGCGPRRSPRFVDAPRCPPAPSASPPPRQLHLSPRVPLCRGCPLPLFLLPCAPPPSVSLRAHHGRTLAPPVPPLRPLRIAGRLDLPGGVLLSAPTCQRPFVAPGSSATPASAMDFRAGASDGLQPLLENSRQQGSLIKGLLERRRPSPKPFSNRILSRLYRVRSAPPLDTIDLSRLQQSRAKHISRAARSLPPPSPFQQDGGMSTIFKAIIALGIYLLVGLLSFSLLEIELHGTATSAHVDALYFAIVTMTTVGYGDLVPKTVGAKLFTCAFVFAGFGLVGALLSGAANYLVEKQEKLLVQKIYLKYVRKEHNKELVVDDDDDDEVVAAHWKMLIAGVAVVIHIVAGMFAMMWWEGMSFIDGFYLVCVTVTTLGYGDRSFRTQGGRIFAVFWILSSTVCVAQFFLYLAESRTEERQHEIACWALHRPTTPSDLEAADMDGDGVVSAAEFVIFKLKEVGKIAEEDVQEILKEFAALDYDESGTLNVSDIHISALVKET